MITRDELHQIETYPNLKDIPRLTDEIRHLQDILADQLVETPTARLITPSLAEQEYAHLRRSMEREISEQYQFKALREHLRRHPSFWARLGLAR